MFFQGGICVKELTTKSKYLYRGKIINLCLDEVSLPNGKKSTREVVEHPGAVVIIPLLHDGRVAVIKQYRKPADEILIEFPAGKIEQNEDPLNCAKRELLEETGYKANTFTKLSSFYTTPGFSNEFIYLYLAEGLIKEQQQLEQDEFLEVEFYCIEELMKMVLNNKIKGGKTIIGLLWLKLLKQGVFHV